MSIIEKALDKLGRQKNARDGVQALPVIDEITVNTPLPLYDDGKNFDEFTVPDGAPIGNQKIRRESAHQKISESINIDLDKLGSLGFITPTTKNLHLFEQYRHIKMRVLGNAIENNSTGNSNIIIVTSAVPGEGKTYSSLNLALSIAYEYNNTVLFIDGDVQKKMSTMILGAETRPGLLDFLTGGETSLSDVLLGTNIEKFTFLPSGKYHERATELYSSKRMLMLMQELSERYNDRLIIIDTPPLLQDTSATAIAKFAGKVILVIEAEKTPRHYVEEAIRLVNRDKLLGIILNKSNQRYGSEYGYYSTYT